MERKAAIELCDSINKMRTNVLLELQISSIED